MLYQKLRAKHNKTLIVNIFGFVS